VIVLFEQEHNEFGLEIRRLNLVIDIHKFKKELIGRRTEEELSLSDINTEEELSLIDKSINFTNTLRSK
jgi:hypothetical protein